MGFWVGGLSARDQFEIAACGPVLAADDRLAAGRYAADGDGDEAFRADVLASYAGDEALADAALYARLEARVAAQTARRA